MTLMNQKRKIPYLRVGKWTCIFGIALCLFFLFFDYDPLRSTSDMIVMGFLGVIWLGVGLAMDQPRSYDDYNKDDE